MKHYIPYVTSYYKKYWGFCIKDNQKKIINKNYSTISKIRDTLNKYINN